MGKVLSTLFGGWFVQNETLAPGQDLLSQIWQHPDAVRGAWDRSFVVVYMTSEEIKQWQPSNDQQNGYFAAVFNDGKDFLPRKVMSRAEVADYLQKLQTQQGITYRYTNAEMTKYSQAYGIYFWDGRYHGRQKPAWT